MSLVHSVFLVSNILGTFSIFKLLLEKSIMKNMRGDFRSIGRMKNNFFICISE